MPGSGKTSTLTKLASDQEIQEKFFVVKFSIKDELNVAAYLNQQFYKFK